MPAPAIPSYDAWRSALALLPEEAPTARIAVENRATASRYAREHGILTPDDAIRALHAGLVASGALSRKAA